MPTTIERLSKDELHQVILRFQQAHDEGDASLVMEQIDPLVLSRVRRVLRPTTEFDDLYQVARMAAFRAIERWRPDGGASFTTFATRSMDGSLKRYFRDRMWDVHVTRSAKNQSLRITTFMRHFESDHGRPGSEAELADYSGMTVEEVRSGQQAANAYSSDSLNVRVSEDGAELGELLPDVDHRATDRDDLLDIYETIKDLPDRQRRIVYLRYFHDLTQREIADRIGCSQMHVSRLLRRSLDSVKASVTAA